MAVWRVALDGGPQLLAQEFIPAFSTKFPSDRHKRGSPILLSNLDPPPSFDGPFPLAVTSRPGPDPRALVLWRLNNGGDGIHAGIVHLPPVPSKIVHVGKPKGNSATLSPFTVQGWAIDREATTGTGIDRVWGTVYSVPRGQFYRLGDATYGLLRPGVAERFGDPRFEPSGFEFVVDTLPDGDYHLTLHANSTVDGVFIPIGLLEQPGRLADPIFFHVGPDPRMRLDRPKEGASVPWPIDFAGWAIDRAAPSGSGVDAVQVSAIPDDGGPAVFMGEATFGKPRAGVAALYGSQFELSGYELTSFTRLAPGDHTFEVRARSTATGDFSTMKGASVTVEAHTVVNIGEPKDGSVVGSPFQVRGWAFHTGAPGGVGVNAVHVWAFPNDGSPAFPLGAAQLGESRPGVADAFDAPELELSGFRLTVSEPMPLGSYLLRIFVRDTITNTFSTVRERNVTVTTNPVMVVNAPAEGSTVTFPFKVAGWAVDLPAALGPGVDTVHVWAFPHQGAAGIKLGAAIYGKSRPGVAAMFEDPTKELSGFRLDVAGGLASGSYTLGVFARSTVTGTFNNTDFRTIVVP